MTTRHHHPTPTAPPQHAQTGEVAGHGDPRTQPSDDPGDGDTWTMPLTSQQAALDALKLTWGDCYEIGVDNIGQWWYKRRDGKGGTETARTPDDLRIQLASDYTFLPVHPQSPPSSASGHPATEGKAIQWT